MPPFIEIVEINFVDLVDYLPQQLAGFHIILGVLDAEDIKARGYNLDIKNPHAVANDHGDPETLRADLARAEAETAAYRDQLKAILAEALAR